MVVKGEGKSGGGEEREGESGGGEGRVVSERW